MTVRNTSLALLFMIVSAAMLGGSLAVARPHASRLVCEAFPDSPHCAGSMISCGFCHNTVPPTLNSFGRCARSYMQQTGRSFPETDDEMYNVISGVGDEDCDEDGYTVMQEIMMGSQPGNGQSVPLDKGCGLGPVTNRNNPHYNVCEYDNSYVYKKIWLDVCGEPPSYEEYADFQGLSETEQKLEITDLMTDCIKSENWIGKDGVIWEIAHYKVRPVGSVKAGEDAGILPIVDYYADYHLFIYSQINGNDAREQLLADFTVTRTGGNGSPTQYVKQSPSRLLDGQVMQPEFRVGLLTSFWNLGFYLNYTGVARVLVAQAFRAYLGIELDKMQGMNPPAIEDSGFRDYDQKGVSRPECANCHATIDPMAYPFRNYNGLTGTSSVLQGQNASGLSSVDNLGDETNLTPLSYSKPRMDFFEQDTPGMSEIPEAGYIFGQRVENLWEWAEVLVNSDQFAANTVRDYWRVMVGHEPRPDEQEEFKKLWQDFKTVHNYSVEAMLHDLIKTDAYGVP
ncbi:MAG: hypothetical protein ACOH5I_08370 [Oligoflexus sp.]